jgi:hypothetical protein
VGDEASADDPRTDGVRGRLLVETLDGAGQVTNQRIAYVPGELGGGGRLYFQVPTAPAPAYRVRVYSYDRMERDGNFRSYGECFTHDG